MAEGDAAVTGDTGNTNGGGAEKTVNWAVTAGADAEVQGYLSNRGWDKLDPSKAALEAIKAHRNAEKLLGGPADRLLRIPTDSADADGWGKVYTALGRPKDAAGYDFTTVKDADEGFINFVRDFAFKHNLSKADGEALAKEFTQYAGKIDGDDTKAKEFAVAKEQADLKRELGFDYQAKMLTAQNAVAKLGIDPAAVKALEGQVGYKAVMEMFIKIGGAIGEDKFITSEATGRTMTPQGAQARMAELKSDPEWTKRYMEGGKKEFQEMKDLIFITTNGGQGARR